VSDLIGPAALPTPEQIPGGTVAKFLRLIRFSHTIFALPFALGALIVAANGWPSIRILGLVLICMVSARTAAMLFNRWVDWSLDQRNPRTASRHLLVPKPVVLAGILIASGVFVAGAALINRLTLSLSPLALLCIFFYSVTKRFTAATHFFLGLALGIAPIAAWIARTGRIELAPVILGIGVICWVAGFDLIYATQDYEFDRQQRLHSLVVRLGIRQSLRVAQVLHAVMFVALIGFGLLVHLGWIYFSAMPLVLAALWFEHRSASQADVAAINRAFFESNAFLSALFVIAVCLDRLF
jgi:4-hydroxybenzoate polyprenyltransferase